MSIRILPPQLANQIAAGEVVERPASVIKELIENSLDAGATRIDIDIERGGSKLIRIRDNGSGIPKDELALALARHATSKIATLEDLEAIMSLGFRGEALASISSVSRLILNSCTADQTEAWQAYAEGRDMQVTIKPVAHPIGTTIEVLDLFYNTPARRRFLRTEKTEFNHIDEVIRRIALARFDVTLNLQHNGKLVRQYRAVKELEQRERRLGSVCGTDFLQQALSVCWEHGDLKISGWVVDPAGVKKKNFFELQYCYVNGRMVRDRLLNHAIRQAYQDQLSNDLQPAYVLYLEVDPHQIDVNVHPAKHEVRFHQSRMVHDFVYQAVLTVLQQGISSELVHSESGTALLWQPENRVSAGGNQFNQSVSTAKKTGHGSSINPSSVSYASPKPSEEQFAQESQLYRQLLETDSVKGINVTQSGTDLLSQGQTSTKPLLFPSRPAVTELSATVLSRSTGDFGRVLTIWQASYAIIEYNGGLALVALAAAECYLKQVQLLPKEESLRSQPLLIPLVIVLDENERRAYQTYQQLLTQMGMQLALVGDRLEIRAVPLPLRQQNLQKLIPTLLGYLSQQTTITTDSLAGWLAHELQSEQAVWNQSQAIQLLAELERLCPDAIRIPANLLLQPIDLQSALIVLNTNK